MSMRRRGILATLVILGAVGGVSPPASAQRAGDPIMGDYNRDGLTDLAFLGATQPDRCSVIVQYATSPGVYLPPAAHTYLRPGGDIVDSCPDIGAAFDWDGTVGDELWIGWSGGAPPTLGYNRLILDDTRFIPVETAVSPITPVYIGIADFTGDGRTGAYSYGLGGLASLLIEIGGGEVPGPVRWCTVPAPTNVTIKDFNRNHAMDALVAYTQGCDDGGNGVVVVLNDGTVHRIESSPAGSQSWTARVTYANGDRTPDVRTRDSATGAISDFIGLGDGSFVEAPVANGDAVYPTVARKTIIDVLGNDHVTSAARVSILTPPRYGTAQVLSDRRIAYTPTATPARDDRFAYRVTENGRQSSTSVYVRFPG